MIEGRHWGNVKYAQRPLTANASEPVEDSVNQLTLDVYEPRTKVYGLFSCVNVGTIQVDPFVFSANDAVRLTQRIMARDVADELRARSQDLLADLPGVQDVHVTAGRDILVEVFVVPGDLDRDDEIVARLVRLRHTVSEWFRFEVIAAEPLNVRSGDELPAP